MSVLNLFDQLLKLTRKVQEVIDAIDDGYPLKGWFAVELRRFTPQPRKLTLEDLNARMRAVRQLEYMATTMPHRDGQSSHPEESTSTNMAREPAVTGPG